MRKRVISVWVGLFMGMSVLLAQDVSDGVIGAFKAGSSQRLTPYLGETVNLSIQNKSTHADKQAVEKAMAAFFSGNKVSDFLVNHRGKRDESGFVVGTLTTANGSFRVNCFLRKVRNNYVIHQIRIDKTNE